MKVPFVDLRAQNDEVRGEIEAAISKIIDQSAFVGGPAVEGFEQQFAALCGTRYAVACANGTDALKLALMAADVGFGDEVITVPHTFIATVEAITLLGAHPMFIDIDGPTYLLSPYYLARFLAEECRVTSYGQVINKHTGRRVVAVLPVHLYGLVADMGPLLDIAGRYGLKIIEDACQAHGATYMLDGVERRAGSFGAAAAFSFYPGKNLGALGEGGAVTTDEAHMDEAMRQWREHGQSHKYYHMTAEGWNSRLDTLQCAILSIKLGKLNEWNARRRQIAAWYRERLAGDDRIEVPLEPAGRQHVYHLFVVRVPDRDEVRDELNQQGISTGLHYPLPLHLQPAYENLGWGEGDFPETETAAVSILSLPMFPHMTEDQVDYVCRVLRNAVARSARSTSIQSRAA